eukprot:gene43295-52919_t
MNHSSHDVHDYSAKQRFEQARLQYENLLMQTSSLVLNSDNPPLLSSSSGVLANQALKTPVTRMSNSYHSPDRQESSHSPNNYQPERSFPAGTLRHVENSLPVSDLSSRDKEDIIIALRKENERLKQKLHFALEAAEQLVQEAQDTNMRIVSEYETKLRNLESDYSCLEEENKQLRSQVEAAHGTLAQEHAHLQSAVSARRFVGLAETALSSLSLVCCVYTSIPFVLVLLQGKLRGRLGARALACAEVQRRVRAIL